MAWRGGGVHPDRRLGGSRARVQRPGTAARRAAQRRSRRAALRRERPADCAQDRRARRAHRGAQRTRAGAALGGRWGARTWRGSRAGRSWPPPLDPPSCRLAARASGARGRAFRRGAAANREHFQRGRVSEPQLLRTGSGAGAALERGRPRPGRDPGLHLIGGPGAGGLLDPADRRRQPRGSACARAAGHPDLRSARQRAGAAGSAEPGIGQPDLLPR